MLRAGLVNPDDLVQTRPSCITGLMPDRFPGPQKRQGSHKPVAFVLEMPGAGVGGGEVAFAVAAVGVFVVHRGPQVFFHVVDTVERYPAKTDVPTAQLVLAAVPVQPSGPFCGLVVSAEIAVFFAVGSDAVLMQSFFGIEFKGCLGFGAVETEDVVFRIIFVMLALTLRGEVAFAFEARPSVLIVVGTGLVLFAVHGWMFRPALLIARIFRGYAVEEDVTLGDIVFAVKEPDR